MKPITLCPHEIRRLLSTGSVTVWRPMKPQPVLKGDRWIWNPSGKEIVAGVPERGAVWRADKLPTETGAAGIVELAPHPPGSECWVKERFGWAVTPKGKSVIVYQADNQARPVLCDNEGEGDCVGVGKKPVEYVAVDGVLWKAAQRMPRWASRLSVTSTAVQARQVDSLCDRDAEAEVFSTGLKSDCECWSCCNGEHAGDCFECAGWGEVNGTECDHCGAIGTCPVCEGACSLSALFASWWQSRYGDWQANPWAWAYRVEVKEA